MPDVKKLKTPLSDKLHVAIRQAVSDVMAVRKDKRYEVDMGVWHAPFEQCLVCLAGATIARRTPAGPGEFVEPNDADKMLLALDCVRAGDVCDAFNLLGLQCPVIRPDYVTDPVYYPDDDNEEDVQKWRANMLRIADWVEENVREVGQ